MTAIDIQKIIFAKSGKKISAPIASFLRRIIHQREINEIIQSGEGLPPREFVAHTLREMQIRYRICGFRPIVGQRYHVNALYCGYALENRHVDVAFLIISGVDYADIIGLVAFAVSGRH
jgi:hypothetical protein